MKTKAIYVLWEARYYSGGRGSETVGILIAPNGNPNEAIGIVWTDPENGSTMTRECIDMAASALAFPWELETVQFPGLAFHGHYPAWMHGLRVVPHDTTENGVYTIDCIEEENRQLQPVTRRK